MCDNKPHWEIACFSKQLCHVLQWPNGNWDTAETQNKEAREAREGLEDTKELNTLCSQLD